MTAVNVAVDETHDPSATAQTKLEDAGLRTADERALYALRVAVSVKNQGYTLEPSRLPQEAQTKVIEVARAIVAFAG